MVNFCPSVTYDERDVMLNTIWMHGRAVSLQQPVSSTFRRTARFMTTQEAPNVNS